MLEERFLRDALPVDCIRRGGERRVSNSIMVTYFFLKGLRAWAFFCSASLHSLMGPPPSDTPYRDGESSKEEGHSNEKNSGDTYSKFLVQIPILTPFLSRYPISSSSPGCGSWCSMAADSIARMAAYAASCSSVGRDEICPRISVFAEMPRADLFAMLRRASG